MKATINREGCIACGLCAEICPSVFRMAEDGLAETYRAPAPDAQSAAREAAESCPVSVISVEE